MLPDQEKTCREDTKEVKKWQDEIELGQDNAEGKIRQIEFRTSSRAEIIKEVHDIERHKQKAIFYAAVKSQRKEEKHRIGEDKELVNSYLVDLGIEKVGTVLFAIRLNSAK